MRIFRIYSEHVRNMLELCLELSSTAILIYTLRKLSMLLPTSPSLTKMNLAYRTAISSPWCSRSSRFFSFLNVAGTPGPTAPLNLGHRPPSLWGGEGAKIRALPGATSGDEASPVGELGSTNFRV